MMSKAEVEIWREGFALYDKYRDALKTPDDWMEMSNAVRDMANSHATHPVAARIGVCVLDALSDLYRDGRAPEPAQRSFFSEEDFQ